MESCDLTDEELKQIEPEFQHIRQNMCDHLCNLVFQRVNDALEYLENDLKYYSSPKIRKLYTDAEYQFKIKRIKALMGFYKIMGDCFIDDFEKMGHDSYKANLEIVQAFKLIGRYANIPTVNF